MRLPKIELTTANGGDRFSTYYFYTVIAANGEPLAHSETFESKQAAQKSIRSLRRAALVATTTEIEE